MCNCIIIVSATSSASSSPYDIRTAYYCQKHWCVNIKFQWLQFTCKAWLEFYVFFCWSSIFPPVCARLLIQQQTTTFSDECLFFVTFFSHWQFVSDREWWTQPPHFDVDSVSEQRFYIEHWNLCERNTNSSVECNFHIYVIQIVENPVIYWFEWQRLTGSN